MSRTRFLTLGIGVILLIVLITLFWPSSTPSVPTADARHGTFDIVVVESGSIRSRNSYTVTTPRLLTGGSLQVVYLAPEGTIADSGDVLVRFDPTNALKRINDKQTELKTAMADLAKLRAQQSGDEAQAKTEFETARLNFQLAEIARQRMQFEPEAKRREADLEFERAKLTFEQARLNLENRSVVRRSELGNLQLRISQIQSDIDASTKEMDQLTIKAPIRGLIVYENNWSTGRKITTGDQPWSGMPLISLPDLSSMQVEVAINEMDIAKVKTGQRVSVVPDAFPDKSFTGRISTVSQIGRERGSGSNIKVFDIVVDLDSTDEVLKPGITTTNTIVVGGVRNVTWIPIVSVFEEDGSTVAFVQDGGSFDRREVSLGQRNDNFVIVTKGIRAGERVALRHPEREDEESPQKSAGPSAPAVSSGE